jgi:hypothetical protein
MIMMMVVVVTVACHKHCHIYQATVACHIHQAKFVALFSFQNTVRLVSNLGSFTSGETEDSTVTAKQE